MLSYVLRTPDLPTHTSTSQYLTPRLPAPSSSSAAEAAAELHLPFLRATQNKDGNRDLERNDSNSSAAAGSLVVLDDGDGDDNDDGADGLSDRYMHQQQQLGRGVQQRRHGEETSFKHLRSSSLSLSLSLAAKSSQGRDGGLDGSNDEHGGGSGGDGVENRSGIGNSWHQHQRDLLLSPPVVAIVCAAVLANVCSPPRPPRPPP